MAKLRAVPGRPGKPLVLELDLTRGLLEAPPASPLAAVRALHRPMLRQVVEALRKAARDSRVVALVAHVGARQPSLAQSGELRAAVKAFGAAGKRTVCWAESFGEMGPGNVGYHLAAAFEEVWLQESGDLGLTGMVAEAVFVRGSLDKLGVLPQLGQRAEYKTAANTFTEKEMTSAHREMLTAIVRSATDAVVSDVAADRGLDEAQVREAVDVAPLAPAEAVRRGLVDRVGYRADVYAALRARFGEVELRYVERYGHGLAGELGGLARRPAGAVRGRPVVAVVQASGPIRLGRSGGTPYSGHSIGSDSLGAALRAAGRDDRVRAVVLRVDSPGGSYVASDAIRREVLAVREAGKPVVASMADVAGSGGYYIAMPADVVVANAGTLTGSIGVVAGKQVIRDGLEKAGVAREQVVGGRFADMLSSNRPFDAEEWRRLEDWLDRVYDDFTTKAAADRGLPVDRLLEVAKGRVWTGADALRLGLVDRLGGLAAAVEVACERAGLAREEVEVRAMPRLRLLDRLLPSDNSESAAAVLGDGVPLLDAALAGLGLSGHGVLTMPFGVRLR